MILGIERIVGKRDLEPGRFYITPGYNGSILFQCIASQMADGRPSVAALIIAINDEPELSVELVPGPGPFVLLPPVEVRVDPPSISGSAYTQNLTSGLFFILGDEAYVTAPTGSGGHRYSLVSISEGAVLTRNPDPNWIGFSRWSLVVKEAGEEIVIASFGQDEG